VPRPDRRLVIIIAFAGIVGLWLAARAWVWGPVQPVIDQRVYRAAQPDKDRIAAAIRKHSIQTVVNLRGPQPKKRWYKIDYHPESVIATQELGVARRDLRFRALDSPPRLEVLQLLGALEESAEPILLHCESGIDRSGWAAGFARLLNGDSLEAARAQLTWYRGHVCRPSRCPLHRFFDEYEAHLLRSRLSHDGSAFRRWIAESYAPEPFAATISVDPAGPLTRRCGEPIEWRVEAINRSASSWDTRSGIETPIALGVRIIGPLDAPRDDTLALFRDAKGPATDIRRVQASRASIASGESEVFAVSLASPPHAGYYYLQFDMVQENVNWFSNLGWPGEIITLNVVDSCSDDPA
jgi:hypothetical protein